MRKVKYEVKTDHYNSVEIYQGHDLGREPVLEKTTIEEHDGYFHMFTGGQMSEPVAIVEDMNGHILSIPIAYVKFTNRPKD